MTYDELVARSAARPYRQPTPDNRLERFADRRGEVEQHAAGVRPILHARVAALLDAYLAIKRQLGTPIEREVYADLDRTGLVTRLLQRRPLAFLNASDSYLLRDGTRSHGGFEAIGTDAEQPPLTLATLNSYDDMQLSALLGVSVPTHFINCGSRDNCGIRGKPGSFEPKGIYVGLVGARFERPERMEWAHVRVTPEQNRPERGYGAQADPDAAATRLLRAWAVCYGLDHLPSYAEAEADASGRFLSDRRGQLFDTHTYRQRMRMVIEPFLLDANDRARAAGTRAYVHTVGLGLGVWQVDRRQAQLLADVHGDVLRAHALPHLADLDFSWFGDASACGGVPDGDTFSEGGNDVRIHFSRRDPAARLTGDDAGKLLVAAYAWDSNAYPGNEYWLNSLQASGDPAAACCSTIPELQNPDVNPRVSGDAAVVFGAEGAAPAPLR